MQEPSTMQVTTIGIDLAKSVFQVHGVDAAGSMVVKIYWFGIKFAALARRQRP